MSPDERADRLMTRMFRRRLGGRDLESWRWVDIRNLAFIPGRSAAREHILRLVRDGYRVTTGYTCTSCRGYHDHWILYKARAGQTERKPRWSK